MFSLKNDWALVFENFQWYSFDTSSVPDPLLFYPLAPGSWFGINFCRVWQVIWWDFLLCSVTCIFIKLGYKKESYNFESLFLWRIQDLRLKTFQIRNKHPGSATVDTWTASAVNATEIPVCILYSTGTGINSTFDRKKLLDYYLLYHIWIPERYRFKSDFELIWCRCRYLKGQSHEKVGEMRP
jgi:hypothetical protein